MNLAEILKYFICIENCRWLDQILWKVVKCTEALLLLPHLSIVSFRGRKKRFGGRIVCTFFGPSQLKKLCHFLPSMTFHKLDWWSRTGHSDRSKDDYRILYNGNSAWTIAVPKDQCFFSATQSLPVQKKNNLVFCLLWRAYLCTVWRTLM